MNPSISAPHASNVNNFKFWEACPGAIAVLLAVKPFYTIVAVSNDFVFTSGFKREDVIGKSHFEVFPKNLGDPASSGVHSLQNSFDYILQHKTSHSLPLVRFDIPDSEGGFLEKYWKRTNTPVFSEKGELVYVIHTTEAVTDQIRAERTEEKHQAFKKFSKITGK